MFNKDLLHKGDISLKDLFSFFREGVTGLHFISGDVFFCINISGILKILQMCISGAVSAANDFFNTVKRHQVFTI